MKLISIWLGKFLLLATRLRGGGGSALPGLVVESIYPDFMAVMAKKLPEGSVLVTGTNGKTTTTKMLRQILEDSGKKIVTNRAGSNMSRGVAAAFIEHATWWGSLRGDIGLFEVDEAFVAVVAEAVRPRTVVVLNLLRDQLDRYGELDRTAQLIGDSLEYAETAILNYDDPLVVDLCRRSPNKCITFGAVTQLQAEVPHDAALLSRVAQATTRKLQANPEPTSLLLKAKPQAERQALELNVAGTRYIFDLQLLGVYNAYNAAAAAAVAHVLGLEMAAATASLARVTAAFGRTELIKIGDKQLQLLLVKNPSGFNQIIQTFLINKSNLPLLIAINDKFADGRDVSWLWDVDFERLKGQSHTILTSGLRSYDMAVRLKYTDVNVAVEPDLHKALERFIAELPSGATGYIVPTYTAMLELRKLLAKQANLSEVWE